MALIICKLVSRKRNLTFRHAQQVRMTNLNRQGIRNGNLFFFKYLFFSLFIFTQVDLVRVRQESLCDKPPAYDTLDKI